MSAISIKHQNITMTTNEEFNILLENIKVENFNDAENVRPLFNEEISQRYNCIQSLYLRSSWLGKLSFLKDIFELIKGKEKMRIWFEIIQECCFDKISAYCELVSFTDVPSDNVLLDNNRSLDSETLALSLKSSLEWFMHFNDHQEILFFGLIGMGGNALMKNICKHILSIYKHEHALNLTQLEVKKQGYSSIISLDTSDPDEAYVIKLRKDWYDLILKYQKGVEAKNHSLQKKEKKEKKKKTSPVNKKDKKIKTSKVNKKVKRGKGKDSKKSNRNKKTAGIDYIQTLPIWTVKKIFSYLDKKTLKKIKSVNSYWSFAIDSYQNDLKARKNLDNLIKSAMKNFGDTSFISKNLPPLESKQICKKKINKETRLKIEGTCCKEIREEMCIKGEKFENSLFAMATKSLASDYLIPINEIKVFPRKPPNPVELYSVYKSPTCVKYEGGVKLKKHASQYELKGLIEMQHKIEIISPQPSAIGVEEPEQNEEEKQEAKVSIYFVPQLERTYYV